MTDVERALLLAVAEWAVRYVGAVGKDTETMQRLIGEISGSEQMASLMRAIVVPENRSNVMVAPDSLIFLPTEGSGEFSDIAGRMRAAAGPASWSRVVAVAHSYTEFVDVPATHLGLDAMGTDGMFHPLALVPLLPFSDQTSAGSFRSQPLFRLAWYGHPNESLPRKS